MQCDYDVCFLMLPKKTLTDGRADRRTDGRTHHFKEVVARHKGNAMKNKNMARKSKTVRPRNINTRTTKDRERRQRQSDTNPTETERNAGVGKTS